MEDLKLNIIKILNGERLNPYELLISSSMIKEVEYARELGERLRNINSEKLKRVIRKLLKQN